MVPRDGNGHLQRLGPAVLATWDSAEDAFEHFGWGDHPRARAARRTPGGRLRDRAGPSPGRSSRRSWRPARATPSRSGRPSAPTARPRRSTLRGTTLRLAVQPGNGGGAHRGSHRPRQALRRRPWPTFGHLAGHSRTVKEELRANLLERHRRRVAGLPGHGRLRGVGRPVDRERDPLRARPRVPRRARPGQDPDGAAAGRPARRLAADRRGVASSTTTRWRRSARPPVPSSSLDGDATPIDWLPRDRRYAEKLATPDITIADLIGEVDPIKVAEGRYLSDELTLHYGLIPRANRGIFAINELPDLAEGSRSACSTSSKSATSRSAASRPAAARPVHGRLGQPGGLHLARPDHHPAQGPARLADPHPLSRGRSTTRWRSSARRSTASRWRTVLR